MDDGAIKVAQPVEVETFQCLLATYVAWQCARDAV